MDDVEVIVIGVIECDEQASMLDQAASEKGSLGTKCDFSKESLRNILDIVGYDTPVRSHQLEDENIHDNEQEYDNSLEEIKPVADVEAKTNESNIQKLPESTNALDPGRQQGNENNDYIMPQSALTNLQGSCNHLDSESETASEGLQYDLSDMSLRSSINLSQRTAASQVKETREMNALNSDGEFFSGIQKGSKYSVADMRTSTQCQQPYDIHMNRKFGQVAQQRDSKVVYSQTYDETQLDGKEKCHINTTESNQNEFFNLSDILHNGSTLPQHLASDKHPIFATPENDNRERNVPDQRRLTLQPVYMSTPLTEVSDSLTHTPYLQPQPLQINNLNKENYKLMPQSQAGKTMEQNYNGRNMKEASLQRIAMYRCQANHEAETPKSVMVMGKTSKRLLSSKENIPTADLQSQTVSVSMDFSHRDVGMTTLFDKAERHGVFEATNGGESLAQSDKEEMEKLIGKLNNSDHVSPGILVLLTLFNTI